MKFTKEQANKAQVFKKFNLLRDEEISQAKIKKTYNKLIFLAHPDRGGSTDETAEINLAKKILLDSDSLENYKKVLNRYNLPDGLEKDANFSPKLTQLRKKYSE